MTRGDSIKIKVDEESKTTKKLEKSSMPGVANIRRVKKGIAVSDFVLRLGALAAALGASCTMGMADEKLPFFTQFLQFEATYDDMPTFSFFVMAMAFVSSYLFLSLAISIVTIIRPISVAPRLTLLILDTVLMTLATTSTAAATGMVYLAHNGNSNVNWLAFCMQFTEFCQVSSGAVISSFVGVAFMVLLIALSAFALRRIRL